MAVSPTQRALAHCKKQGWVAGITERWNQYANVRQDLFGFIDLVVLRYSDSAEDVPVTVSTFRSGGILSPFNSKAWSNLFGDILAVQVTSGSNVAARVTKIKAEPRARQWLRCGGVIEVWGYRKVKVKRGGKAVRWELRVVPVTLGDFET